MVTSGMIDDDGDDDGDDDDGGMNHQRRVLNELKRKGARKYHSVRNDPPSSHTSMCDVIDRLALIINNNEL